VPDLLESAFRAVNSTSGFLGIRLGSIAWREGMKRWLFVAVLTFVSLATVRAQGPQGVRTTAEEFEAKLGYETGLVTLKDGLATIRMPSSFRFLGPEGSRRLLTEGWGNPPESADEVLGMLIPTSASPLSDEGWGIVITYDEDGYVNDGDAAGINYDKLLKQMQEETVAANEARSGEGFEPVTLVGWAEPPSYDAAAHKLYWAKDLVFGTSSDHTLNYNIRILGRRGVLVLNGVASISQLGAIKSETKNLLTAVDFNEGHRYTDFLPGKDKAATYGIAGLIVGATAAKAGFFKALWIGILAFKKVIIGAGIALAAALRKLFVRKPQEPISAESNP
jgi:uncharacterized membrane-anchored protein